ncbi:MAG: GTP-binding protein [Nanoarchaeota archaeon]
MSSQDRIKELEEELSNTKYNKKTQFHIGLVKAKLAKIKEDAERKASAVKKGEGYHVKKTGDATVVLLGFPSVGKSTILNKLTNAQSAVAAYDFTTLDVIPGLLQYNHAKIQILDVPGIVSGAATGRGRGREVLSVLRNADLALIIIDATKPGQFDAIMEEVFQAGLRLNKDKPDVRISKKPRGGLRIGQTVPLDIDKKTIEGILRELGINNADVLIRTPIHEDDLIDVVMGNRSYIPSLVVINKIDLVDEKEKERIKLKIKPDLMISAQQDPDFERVKKGVFEKLRLMRIYLKEVGKRADMDEPMIVHRSTTLLDLCNKIHKDFTKKFRFAKIWGPGAKFPGQEFRKLEKNLQDGDIVEIHIR